MKLVNCAIVLVMEPSFEDEETIAYVETHDLGEVHHTIRVMTKLARTSHKPDEEQRWERNLSVKEAKKIMDRLNNLTITGSPDGAFLGKDGTFWRLEISSEKNKMELKWWSSLPEGWKSVWKLVKVLQELANYKSEPQWWQVWR